MCSTRFLCCARFFEELRDQNTRLPNSKALPDLFSFTKEETNSMTNEIREKLVPKWSPRGSSTQLGLRLGRGVL